MASSHSPSAFGAPKPCDGKIEVLTPLAPDLEGLKDLAEVEVGVLAAARLDPLLDDEPRVLGLGVLHHVVRRELGTAAVNQVAVESLISPGRATETETS